MKICQNKIYNYYTSKMWRDSAAKLFLLDVKMWKVSALIGNKNVERQRRKVIFIRRNNVERQRFNRPQKCGETVPHSYFY